MYLTLGMTLAQSRQPWDYLRIVQTVPGADCTRPLSESACPLVKH